MSDYKLVPVEPTPEMVEAAQDAYMPFGDMDIALRMALLAAPAVQGEPVAWQCVWPGGGEFTTSSYESAKNYRDGALSEHGEDQAPCIRPLYAAPQPAPDAARLVEALEDIGASWNGVNTELERYMRNVARLALAKARGDT